MEWGGVIEKGHTFHEWIKKNLRISHPDSIINVSSAPELRIPKTTNLLILPKNNVSDRFRISRNTREAV